MFLTRTMGLIYESSYEVVSSTLDIHQYFLTEKKKLFGKKRKKLKKPSNEHLKTLHAQVALIVLQALNCSSNCEMWFVLLQCKVD